jgi:hypothetical protein
VWLSLPCRGFFISPLESPKVIWVVFARLGAAPAIRCEPLPQRDLLAIEKALLNDVRPLALQRRKLVKVFYAPAKQVTQVGMSVHDHSSIHRPNRGIRTAE